MPTAADPTTAVMVANHVALTAGVRYWCERADPPIDLVDAQGRLADVWTGPGANADVVILDLELLPGRPAVGELRNLVASGRHVVVYSQRLEDAMAAKCLGLGARAYLTKREGADHLLPAIRAAARGHGYRVPTRSDLYTSGTGARLPELSPREAQVLRTWFTAPSKEAVANELHITIKTVDTYITRVRVKYADLGRAARTKSELVGRALDDGLVTLDELNNR